MKASSGGRPCKTRRANYFKSALSPPPAARSSPPRRRRAAAVSEPPSAARMICSAAGARLSAGYKNIWHWQACREIKGSLISACANGETHRAGPGRRRADVTVPGYWCGTARHTQHDSQRAASGQPTCRETAIRLQAGLLHRQTRLPPRAAATRCPRASELETISKSSLWPLRVHCIV